MALARRTAVCFDAGSLFSDEVLSLVFEGEWTSKPAGIVLLAVLVLSILGLAASALHDARRRRRIKWSRARLFVEHPLFAGPGEGEESIVFGVLRRMCCDDQALAAYATAATARRVAAAQGGLLAGDVAHLLRLQPADGVLGAEGNLARQAARRGLARFASAGFFGRVLFATRAVHPLEAIAHFSFTQSRSSRAFLLCVRLFGAFALSALALLAIAANSERPCVVSVSDETPFLAVAVGSLAVGVAGLPVCLLRLLRWQRFMFSDTWSEASIRSKSRMWTAFDCIFWILGLSYALLCALFVSAFVSAVGRPTATQWLTSAITVVADVLVIIPLTLGGVIGAIASIFNVGSHDADSEFSEMAKRREEVDMEAVDRLVSAIFDVPTSAPKAAIYEVKDAVPPRAVAQEDPEAVLTSASKVSDGNGASSLDLAKCADDRPRVSQLIGKTDLEDTHPPAESEPAPDVQLPGPPVSTERPARKFPTCTFLLSEGSMTSPPPRRIRASPSMDAGKAPQPVQAQIAPTAPVCGLVCRPERDNMPGEAIERIEPAPMQYSEMRLMRPVSVPGLPSKRNVAKPGEIWTLADEGVFKASTPHLLQDAALDLGEPVKPVGSGLSVDSEATYSWSPSKSRESTDTSRRCMSRNESGLSAAELGSVGGLTDAALGSGSPEGARPKKRRPPAIHAYDEGALKDAASFYARSHDSSWPGSAS